MPAITITDLNNAVLDASHIAAIATSASPTTTDRLGVTKKTMAGSLNEYPNAFANAASALASAEAALASATTATTEKNAAAAAKAAAEAARDAALINGKVYTTTAAGLAATTTTQYFSVPSPESAESLILYLNNAGTAVEQKRYPSALLIDLVKYQQGYALTPLVQTVAGITTPDTNSGGDGFWWTNHEVRTADALLQSIAVRSVAAGTVTAVVVNSVGVVTARQLFTVAAGLNTLPVNNIPVPTGSRVFLNPATGGFRSIPGATDSRFDATTYNNTVGGTVGPVTAQATTIAMAFTFGAVPTVKALLDGLEVRALAGDLANYQLGYAYTPLVQTVVGSTTPDTSTGGATFYWSNHLPLGADSLLQAIAVRVVGAGTVKVVVVNGVGVVTAQKSFTAVTGVNTFAVSNLPVPAGSRVFVQPPVGGFRFITGATDLSFPASAYSGAVGGSVGTITTQPTSVALAITFGALPTVKAVLDDLNARTAQALSVSDVVTAATASTTGFTVSVSGTLMRNGVAIAIAGAPVLTATTASDIRYDVIYYDLDTSAIGVQVGTARTIDPSEFIPALTDPKRRALFNCRVTSAAVVTVPVWGVDNFEAVVLTTSQAQGRRLSRTFLPKTRAKIQRGTVLKVMSFGDSITTQQNATPTMLTPNGVNRDRDFYYLESIGADLVGALPKSTAVQLGRADDGQGSIYITMSLVWEMVKALQATGQTVTYDNFSVGSTSTASAVDTGLVPTAWLTAAIALAPDVVVVNFGMNERGNTLTESRMVAIINAFKNANIEVIVMGCARPNAALTGWEFTNRALERAARYASAAFVPTMALYDERYLGVIGCAAIDVSSANRINHPGIREHKALGRELIKLVQGT